MKYSAKEVIQYVEEEDVKFIRLAFCDVRGRQKNISIMPYELQRAFDSGIAFDASAIEGFGDEVHSDLFLRPDPSTLTVLPWRPDHGRVIRMFCSVHKPDGSIFENDVRSILINAINTAESKGYHFDFGTEMEFYLFKLDENGEPTKVPYDNAGYFDIAPEDKGENVRREICLTLEQMGIFPETSHHEEGPGQNEIDFRYSDPLTAADNAVTFLSVVRTVAARNGLYADFSPKPIKDKPGNGFHINISVKPTGEAHLLSRMIAGILDHISELTVFMNPSEQSYDRLGSNKAPKYISWSEENRSQLIRIPASDSNHKRAEVRSPDPEANPYIAFAMLIYAALDGIDSEKTLTDASNVNLYTADENILYSLDKLPETLSDASATAISSDFVKSYLPASIIETLCKK